MKQHHYQATTVWTGNLGSGTSAYTAYNRNHEIRMAGKPRLLGSSDPAFRGDAARHNPEDLLLASLSACHLLWYLHLCAEAGVVVVDYRDEARATMEENACGGRFTEAVLQPQVTVQSEAMVNAANALHERAHELCFIANSVNFPVHCRPTAMVASNE